MSIPIEDADTGREHITDDSEECWCKPRVILVPPAHNDKGQGRGMSEQQYEWAVKYRGVYIYESEEEARRQLNLAQWDVPAVLVRRRVGEWEDAD